MSDDTGKRYVEFDPVRDINRDVDTSVVRRFITVSKIIAQDVTARKYEVQWNKLHMEGSKKVKYTDLFKCLLKRLPEHLALRFNKNFVFKFDGSSYKGHKVSHNLKIGFTGWCYAKKDGCPCTFTCGFTEESLMQL